MDSDNVIKVNTLLWDKDFRDYEKLMRKVNAEYEKIKPNKPIYYGFASYIKKLEESEK